MKTRYTLFASFFAAVLMISACSHKPSAPVTVKQTEMEVPSRAQRGGTAGGHYYSDSLQGDYAGYAELEGFIDRMSAKHGFSRPYLYGLFSQVNRKQWTLNYLGKEHRENVKPSPGSWTRYRAKFLTDQHISAGTRFWGRYSGALRRAQSEYGVNPEHILGIMGVETLYGKNLGNHRIIDALTTLGFDYPRRASYFQEELENFLIMAKEEGLDPSSPKGSYAGAMGLGQFMPSSFLKYAVDFNGDGQRDLWDPEDAIGSIANYFAGHGWRAGEPVVTKAEVEGSGFEQLETGFDAKYGLGELESYGIRPEHLFPGTDSLRLLRLRAATGDQYWLGYENFYVITRYNHSTNYAMAVHSLASAIKSRHGGGGDY